MAYLLVWDDELQEFCQIYITTNVLNEIFLSNCELDLCKIQTEMLRTAIF